LKYRNNKGNNREKRERVEEEIKALKKGRG